MSEQRQADVPPWEARYRAARVSLPQWAEDAPHRCIYVSNVSGKHEVYAWDRSTGTTRQVTDRPNGTYQGAIEPSGEAIWWWSDTDGDEHGLWMRQPFEGGADQPAAPGVPRAYGAGLALGRAVHVVGCSDEGGAVLFGLRSGEEPFELYRHAEDASVGDLSRDESLAAIEHSEHGDSRHPALRVRQVGGGPVGELWDGPGKGVQAIGFAPVPGDSRLLVGHERRGREELLLWDVATGEQTELHLDLPGEVWADWYVDGSALLVHHDHHARSELYRYDLASGELTPLNTPPGVVGGATARPDGSVEYAWSSAAHPPVIRSTAGGVVLAPPGPPPPPSVPVEDVWVDGPGGRVHALLQRPPGSAPPYATIFEVHGGPTYHETDTFDAYSAAWVDHGFAVVRVNYRGSTGYGSAWRDAIEARIGHTELEDIAAVRDALVEQGVVDPARTVLLGGSWGGYLTLLGLGTQPDRWRLGVAAVPVADYVAAYEDEMEGLKAFDRSLFGGSPTEVPERYADSSPITSVDQVRAPVLILAGENDPRCPIRQIENYVRRLEERNVPHEVYRYDAGHGSLVIEERLRQLRAELDFVQRHLEGDDGRGLQQAAE
ncbi:MAG: prolyl oligopeptidase family serine peptidase [Actinomycetota bacterium]|nr:prolyl oligopeptidase family serine peptidase [Actinomycetota bacterium]